jgi:hypothetical protein
MRTTKCGCGGGEIGTQISDDETEADLAECLQCKHQGWIGTYCPQCKKDQGMIHSVAGPTNQRKETGNRWTLRLARALRQLTRSRKAGSQLPPIGQGCLNLRGIEGHDLGQAAVIITRTKAGVRVFFVDSNGRQVSDLKVPSSLMLMEDGLEVVQDMEGYGWI